MHTFRFSRCVPALVIGTCIVVGGVICVSKRVMSLTCGRELDCQRCTRMPSKRVRQCEHVANGEHLYHFNYKGWECPGSWMNIPY